MTKKELKNYSKCPNCKSLLKEVGIRNICEGGWSEYNVSVDKNGWLEYEYETTDGCTHTYFVCNNCNEELPDLSSLEEKAIVKILS